MRLLLSCRRPTVFPEKLAAPAWFALAIVYALLSSQPIASAAPIVSAATAPAATAAAARPGGALSRANSTPFPTSKTIVSAQWTSGRYDPPANQWGDILPTVWGDDGSSYVMMDDGGVDAPLRGGIWRQSLARISGSPPTLSFKHIGNPFSPAPRTWKQIAGDRDRDDGPLGPYYSIGFTEAGGVFYATQQRDWNWALNSNFTGLVGIADSNNHGRTWRFATKPFPAPLGNLTFIVTGGKGGGPAPDGYLYAIGTEREFNASTMLLGRVRPGIANVTDPARWQWFAGYQQTGSTDTAVWSGSVSSAVPVLNWSQHITYPQMTYDAPLHRYLLTFTYSYASSPPAVFKDGAELDILEAPTPWGPFSFVASSSEFGPSNRYGAGFPAAWISADGKALWLKWAANFDGCAKGLNCTGKYGFNVAKVQLTLATRPRVKKQFRSIGILASIMSVSLLLLARSPQALRRAARRAVRRMRRRV